MITAFVLAGCASAPREPWVLTSSGVPPARPPALEQVSTYPQAFMLVAHGVQRELGIAIPPVQVVFVRGGNELEELLRRIGYPARLARSSARQLTAIGGHRTVLVNQARLERGDWPTRVAVLAHEMGHVLQYELGGGVRGTSAQWLREGFAEWLAARVMASVGEDHAERARFRALQRLRLHALARYPLAASPGRIAAAESTWNRLPPLRALGSFPDWVARLRGDAGAALPDYVFVAVDCLIERHGAPAPLRYFEMFAERQEHEPNFRRAFGEDEAHFERRFRRLLSDPTQTCLLTDD